MKKIIRPTIISLLVLAAVVWLVYQVNSYIPIFIRQVKMPSGVYLRSPQAYNTDTNIYDPSKASFLPNLAQVIIDRDDGEVTFFFINGKEITVPLGKPHQVSGCEGQYTMQAFLLDTVLDFGQVVFTQPMLVVACEMWAKGERVRPAKIVLREGPLPTSQEYRFGIGCQPEEKACVSFGQSLGELRGEVVDEQTGEPLPDAQISLTNALRDDHYAGSFSVQIYAGYQASIRITMPGYDDMIGKIHQSYETRLFIDIQYPGNPLNGYGPILQLPEDGRPYDYQFLMVKNGNSPGNAGVTILGDNPVPYPAATKPPSSATPTPGPVFIGSTPTPPPDWQASGLEWQRVPVERAPSPRMEMGYVYDTRRKVIVMTGGTDWATGFGETWEFDIGAWTLREDIENTPARIRPSMVYDSNRQVTVLFGGSDLGDNRFYNDTWEYDGSQWVEVKTDHAPPARNGAAAVYDPDSQSMLIFGGYARWGEQRYLGDTWEYVDGDWVQRFPAHSPEAREAAHMVYATGLGRMILFGGGRNAGGTTFGDTWEWDSEDWARRDDLPLSPPARWAQSMAYDEDQGLTILYGGLTGINGQYADTWSYDGQTWTQVKSYYTPDPRWDASMAYDLIHHRMVLFGGQYWVDGNFAWRNDTWFLGGL